MQKGSCCYEKLYDLQEWSQQLADSSTFLQKPYLGIKALVYARIVNQGKVQKTNSMCTVSRASQRKF